MHFERGSQDRMWQIVSDNLEVRLVGFIVSSDIYRKGIIKLEGYTNSSLDRSFLPVMLEQAFSFGTD